MSLKTYHKKRDFKKSPEPRGRESAKSKHLFVVQKHAASHLHYDFRLELDGVLKSWAVPKGPCLDPSVKRLAVHVEDHPVDYGSFEGIIPAGEYGGGTVMLWDRGTWEPQDADVRKAYQKGNMTFILQGERLKGLWKLVRIKTDEKNWLLIKITDNYAQPIKKWDVTEKYITSVKTDKTMDEIAGKRTASNAKVKKNSINSLANLKKTSMPMLIAPELATLAAAVPTSGEWLHEIKFDGYRMICFIKDKKIQIMTRDQNDWTEKFPHLVKALRALKLPNVILDGELVALDINQHSDFQLLQNTIHKHQDQTLVYYVFDLLYYDKYALSTLPLIKRKELLQQLLPNTADLNIRYSDHVTGSGKQIFINACELKLEGIVSKLANSPYVQKRTRDWLKIKCVKRQEFVVGGFTKPKGQRSYFGSLLLGIYSADKKLKYCGHVGTGFTEESLKMMAENLEKYKTLNMPFAKSPPLAKRVNWVEPKILVEVEFTAWTEEGVLRHPSFKGIRTDKLPKKVTLEEPIMVKEKKSKKTGLIHSLSNPDRVLYPEQNITKLELAEYYQTIQEWMLPYLIKRPLVLVRCPQGRQKKCFYQKHLREALLEPLYPIDVEEKGTVDQYAYIKDGKGLLSLVQLGVLEIHMWNCHVDNIEKPDMIVFDLDPGEDVEWKRVVQGAFFIKEQLEKINLQSFVKTTGGKGLHVVLPIKRKYNWAEIKNFTHAFVTTIVQMQPKNYVEKMTKSLRGGKIFLDYLRNQRGATAIAPYSTRARENATVATPLTWDELNARLNPASFTLKTIPQRLSKLKKDPWEGFFDLRQEIPR